MNTLTHVILSGTRHLFEVTFYMGAGYCFTVGVFAVLSYWFPASAIPMLSLLWRPIELVTGTRVQ